MLSHSAGVMSRQFRQFPRMLYTFKNILCCCKTQNNSSPDGSDSDKVPGTKRMTGEESWTKIKACQLGTTSKRVRGGYCRTWQGRDLVLSTVNVNRMIVGLVVSKLEKL